MGLLFLLDGRIGPIASHLFYLVIKMKVLKIFVKNISTWPPAVRTFKNMKMPQEEHIEIIKYYYIERVLDEYT